MNKEAELKRVKEELRSQVKRRKELRLLKVDV